MTVLPRTNVSSTTTHSGRLFLPKLSVGRIHPINPDGPATRSLSPQTIDHSRWPTHVVHMAQLADEGKLTDQQSALAKAFTTAKARETVSWARELLGGNRILVDYDGARSFADIETLSYEGTCQMQHLIVGKAVTGFSAFL